MWPSPVLKQTPFTLAVLRTDIEQAGDRRHSWGGHGGTSAGGECDNRAAVPLQNEAGEDCDPLLRGQPGLTVGQEEWEEMEEQNADCDSCRVQFRWVVQQWAVYGECTSGWSWTIVAEYWGFPR